VSVPVLERWFGQRAGRVVVDEPGEVVWAEVELSAADGGGGRWLGEVINELVGHGLWVMAVEVEDTRRTPQLRRSASWLCRFETVIRVRAEIGDADWEPVRAWTLGLADWPGSGG